jgi:hypothetical protein
MKIVHVECDPDELLVKKLGCTKKKVEHHRGRTRIVKALQKESNLNALIDEDPGSPRHSYLKALKYIETCEGIDYFTDISGNRIFQLRGKLEDWIVAACKKEKIKLSNYGLPSDPDELTEIINYRLNNFEKLLDAMLEKKNPALSKLQSWLKG